MKILVACEESQAVTIEFRKLGHEAYSCDIEPCSGGHPEWHIQGDVRMVLNLEWDMIIAHPPCTYLANSGVTWLYNKDGSRNEKRWNELVKGGEFFRLFINHPCRKIAIENPIPHKYAVEIIGRKYDQIIHPWQFGHPERKATCLWLKGLEPLKETDNRKAEMLLLPKNQQQRIHYMPPGPERAKMRSKTFPGIAKAMAEQWGDGSSSTDGQSIRR